MYFSSFSKFLAPTRELHPIHLAGDWWLVLICFERKIPQRGCWWLICFERKVLLTGD
jgi:hypothetical protein